MIESSDKLAKKLHYNFNNPDLLKAALSHRSVRGINNERLEFLGDSVLNFVIAAELYRKCPEANEGELSRLRAYLVRGETLSALAQEFQLGNYLHLGAGELKSGGSRRLSILADAMEAILGAIYVDGGIDICKEKILTWYQSRLESISLEASEKDPKTRLQEFLQAKKIGLPVYTVLSIEGESHQQIFKVECRVDGIDFISQGNGSSRRRAEQNAAEKLLETIANV